jgi:hypothetical protein
MASTKKKATAKGKVAFKDLKPKKDPKGGPIYMSKIKLGMLNPQPLPP